MVGDFAMYAEDIWPFSVDGYEALRARDAPAAGGPRASGDRISDVAVVAPACAL
jgi:hypothetical protein